MGRKSKSPKASPAAPTASASHTMDKKSQSVEKKTKKEEVEEDEVPLFSLEAQRQHTAQAAKRPAPPAPLPSSSSSKPLAKKEEAVKAIKPKMSEKEAIAEARPKVSAVLKEVREHMETCVAQARATLDSLRRDERPTDRGVSFLEVKNHVLLNYNLNVVAVLLKKLEGQTPASSKALDRLVVLRTILERTQPIDRKLKYQVDKLVRLAATGAQSADAAAADGDQLQYRPDPSNLVPKAGAAGDEDESEAEGGAAGEEAGDGIYRPPKLASVAFDEAESAAARREKKAEREARRMASSHLLKELHTEVSDRPMEIAEAEAAANDAVANGRLTHEDKERRRYEEDNFVRVVVGKKKRQAPRGSLAELTDFSGFGRITSGETSLPSGKKTMRERMGEVNLEKGRKAKLRPSKRAKRSDGPDVEAS